MPELMHFVACNEVLLDDQENPSLISVFIALEAMSNSGEVINAKAMVPKNWMVFTMWAAEAGDIGKKFTQKLIIETPNGEEFGNNVDDFKMEKVAHTIRTRVAGFPVGIQGNVLMKVWLELSGKRITKIKKSRINVKHVKERTR